MTTKFYHDHRNAGTGRPAPIKISISHNGSTAYIPTNISVLSSQWDSHSEKIIAHPQKAQLNSLIAKKKYDVDVALFKMRESGRLHGLNAIEIRDAVAVFLDPNKNTELFMPRLEAYAERKRVATTKYTYTHTADKIRAYTPKAERLQFTDITPRWLESFDNWMAEQAPSPNARNIILRSIRAVFNDAIDDGVTTYYPFRKFKIKAVPTKSRALSLGQIRKIFSYEGIYVDMFKLSFYLGGISMCDLAGLTQANIVNGRIEYCRQKTGQFCSIAIQPEAKVIIDKYAGTTHLVCIAEQYSDYRNFTHGMACSLKRLGKTYNPHTKKWEGEAICPNVSQYWARYSVATIAAENGTSQEAIAAMLGHSSNTSVTSIYTRANRNKQVDEALRKVIDLVSMPQ